MKPTGRKQKKKSNSPTVQRAAFPFTAIVGQDEMKLALILSVVDPSIGGVLLMGHRGTGKSTAVRALADLLPEISAVVDCPFNCDPKNEANLCYQCRERVKLNQRLTFKPRSIPVVDLPLGATEDRVCGTIAIERALREGVKSFEPGLLAQANRGFLYIDEVNLLEDHLVDVLLDVAATGINRVERESVSVEHPSQFVLVGSGNPEEGELRPQLLDRFGLHVQVTTPTDRDQRVEVVERREAFDRDALEFCQSYKVEQATLRNRIQKARRSFSKVKIDRVLLSHIVEMCIELKVDGHRGELTLMRASRALAALEGRKSVNEDDVKRVAAMCLRHRLRRNPFEETPSDQTIVKALENQFDESYEIESSASNGQSTFGTKGNGNPKLSPSEIGEFRVELDQTPRRPEQKPAIGRKQKHHVMNQKRGRHARSVSSRKLATKIALAATLRAIASLRDLDRRPLTPIESEALRYKLFSTKQGALFIFVIDTSGSMATRRIALAKRVMTDRLKQSYVNRDRVAIISFRDQNAQLDLPPSRSILRARRVIDSLLMGGGTPLAGGLMSTWNLLQSLKKDQGEAVVLLFTDGHANVGMSEYGQPHQIESELQRVTLTFRQSQARIVVVDTQHAFESSAETMRLAKLLNAQFVKPSLSKHGNRVGDLINE